MNAAIRSNARLVAFIRNRGDINREKAAELNRWLKEIERNADAGRFKFVTLGSEDWLKGQMHHKFIAVDDRIVWCGSYNFTYMAPRNYETLLRIDDKDIALQFWKEVNFMLDDEERWEEDEESYLACVGCAGAVSRDKAHFVSEGAICERCYEGR
jgi:phosphatidylserine/phosphatidylglycerophosphate/cardiolipin synthase-like enzyme